jgi:hypothetical protein
LSLFRFKKKKNKLTLDFFCAQKLYIYSICLSVYNCLSTYVIVILFHLSVSLCIYIYIKREREREKEKGERVTYIDRRLDGLSLSLYVYVYIYIYIEGERKRERTRERVTYIERRLETNRQTVRLLLHRKIDNTEDNV